ncbi:MAG: hypothetical protein EPGJADBJ_01695 [Saprospiraceae bacterium]|nr:hypothetical protein [Saprospiraceae bacterium]
MGLNCRKKAETNSDQIYLISTNSTKNGGEQNLAFFVDGQSISIWKTLKKNPH